MPPSRSNARAGSRRPVRQSRTQVQTYQEESSSGDEIDPRDEYVEDTSRHPSVSLRPRETARSYREESTDTNWGDVPDDSDEDSYEVLPADSPTEVTLSHPQAVPRSRSRACEHKPYPANSTHSTPTARQGETATPTGQESRAALEEAAESGRKTRYCCRFRSHPSLANAAIPNAVRHIFARIIPTSQ